MTTVMNFLRTKVGPLLPRAGAPLKRNPPRPIMAIARTFSSGALPGDRLPALRRLLNQHRSDRPLRILETHSGLSGLIAEHAMGLDGCTSFDGMWSSSLTASAIHGMPDIEAVDTTSRLDLVRRTMYVTTKPMIYDGDTGGRPETFRFTVRSLEQLGVSAVIIEDKEGLKRNSLLEHEINDDSNSDGGGGGGGGLHQLCPIDDFCDKIRAGVEASRHPDFMIVARMESLIAGRSMEEAVDRASASVEAGASGVMIHSRRPNPDEVLEFISRFRSLPGGCRSTPVVVVPSSYDTITEDELHSAGADVCIYANHLLRASYPSMLRAAESILTHSRSHEAGRYMMSIGDITGLICHEDATMNCAGANGAGEIISHHPAGDTSSSMASVVHPATCESRGDTVTQTHSTANANGRSIPLKSNNGKSLWPPESHLEFGRTTLLQHATYRTETSTITTSTSSSGAEEESEGEAVGVGVVREGGTKVSPSRLLRFMHSELGTRFFVGVPDSCISSFCAEVDRHCGGDGEGGGMNDDGSRKKSIHAIAANEGAAVGMAIGHHLSTGGGDVPLVYMQNSGLGNAVNPLTSAAHPDVYGIPMILLLGWRGSPGVNDEPQHMVMGRRTRSILDAIGIETFVLPTCSDREAERTMRIAHDRAVEGGTPVAVLARPGTFSGGVARHPEPTDDRLGRREAIELVLEAMGPDDAVVATTGFTSRELYELRHRSSTTTGVAEGGRPPREKHDDSSSSSDFLCVGAMGHAIAIAQGIALSRPDRTVWCLDGDGAALMHLGSSALSAPMGLSNLRHVLFNNEAHESVGGQPTVASNRPPRRNGEGGEEEWSSSPPLSFADLARSMGYTCLGTVSDADELRATMSGASASSAWRSFGPGAAAPRFLEVKVALGTRADLGRPRRTTLDAKRAFMDFLRDPIPATCAESPVAARSGTVRRRRGGDALLLTPGPLTTSNTVKEAMMHDYGSRDASFVDLTAKVRRQLVSLVRGDTTGLTAVLLQGSGTFAVEAMITQFVPPREQGGKLLILSNGAYGRRMAEISDRNDRRHELLDFPETEPLDVTKVDAVLERNSDATHVAIVSCETTTGVLNPVSEIADRVSSRGMRLLIDAMSSFGVIDVKASVPFDAIAASSNKALQGSPGLAFVLARMSALSEARGNARTLTLDLHGQEETFETSGEWRFTPPTHCMLALAQALEELQVEGGVRGRRERYTKNCKILVDGMRNRGFETILPDHVQAPVIVTFRMPEDPRFDFRLFYDGLSTKGYVIYPGKLTSEPSFRVGCIGHIFPNDIAGFLDAVDSTLTELGVDNNFQQSQNSKLVAAS